MNIRTLDLACFTTHDRTSFEFPEAGLVVVTGDNGAGKSSLVEGVAYGAWGKTLRGSAPWREGERCAVELSTDELHIERSRDKGKNGLIWEVFDGFAADAPGSRSDDPDYDTPTKSQEALARLVGSFDVWRRSHVFSSADAAHFTLATDAERKRLIEAILGLDRFDGALERCRDDLKLASSELNTAANAVSTNTTRIEAITSQLEDARTRQAEQPEPPPPPKPLTGKTAAELQHMLSACDRELTASRAKLREADRAGGSHEVVARQVQATLDRLRADKCPTCTQPITDKLRARLTSEVEAAKTKAADEKEAAEGEKKRAESLIAELDEERVALQEKYSKRRDAETVSKRVIEEAKNLDLAMRALGSVVQDAEQRLEKLHATRANLVEDHARKATEHAVLEATERVLGLRGVRAHVLARSLSGIEAMSNTWLAKLGTVGLQVTLKPYTEKKTGGTNDAISLEVHGAGGGFGYKGASGGERRRLDVALLLAMAEVSSAANGVKVGTLFFDEVFDCLDGVGTAAVSDALAELAKERAVVVITHSSALVERLPGAQRVHVTGGRLRAVGES